MNGVTYIIEELPFLYYTNTDGGEIYYSQSDSTGQSVFNLNLVASDELNNKFENNELLIQQNIFIEDVNLNSEVDFNGNDIPDLSGTLSILINTSTANSFSVIETLLLEIDPVQFIIDDTPTAINNGGNNNENFGDEADSDTDDNSSTNSSNDNALLIATVRDINGSGIAVYLSDSLILTFMELLPPIMLYLEMMELHKPHYKILLFQVQIKSLI